MPQAHILALRKYPRIIGLFIALCSFVGFFEAIFPLADLFNHFRIQAVVGLTVCLIAASCLKDMKGFLLCATALAINVSIVGYTLHQTSGIPPLLEDQSPTLSIISSNVLTSNTRYEAVISMVEKEKPDFIVFTEVNDAWIENLQPIEKIYSYSLKHPSEDNFGIAAYSKKPFEGRIKYSGGAGLPILIAKLEGGPTILGIHPLPPSDKWNLSENKLYLEDVASFSATESGPVIVTGDFNTTLWSVTLKPLFEVGLKRINWSGIAYTWPTSSIFFALQIDHFFGKNVKAGDFKVLSNLGSDHYPIRADILIDRKTTE